MKSIGNTLIFSFQIAEIKPEKKDRVLLSIRWQYPWNDSTLPQECYNKFYPQPIVGFLQKYELLVRNARPQYLDFSCLNPFWKIRIYRSEIIITYKIYRGILCLSDKLQISVTLWLRGWQRSAADLAILLKPFVWLRPSIDMNGN